MRLTFYNALYKGPVYLCCCYVRMLFNFFISCAISSHPVSVPAPVVTIFCISTSLLLPNPTVPARTWTSSQLIPSSHFHAELPLPNSLPRTVSRRRMITARMVLLGRFGETRLWINSRIGIPLLERARESRCCLERLQMLRVRGVTSLDSMRRNWQN